MGKAETSMMKDTEKEGEKRGNWVTLLREKDGSEELRLLLSGQSL